MLAYQFEAEIRDGTIKVPDTYKHGFGSKVKVLILPCSGFANKKSSLFPDLKLRTNGVGFDREEANERRKERLTSTSAINSPFMIP
jgi:hypothetical protein